MSKCICANCGRTFLTFELSWLCDDCRNKRFEKRNEKNKPTNADRIRAMSDEELADVLRVFATKPMQGSFLKWLKQPAEGE